MFGRNLVGQIVILGLTHLILTHFIHLTFIVNIHIDVLADYEDQSEQPEDA